MKLLILLLIPLTLFAPDKPPEKDSYKVSLYIYESYYQDKMNRYVSEVSGLEISNVDLHHLLLMINQSDSLGIPHRIMFRLVFKESSYRPYAMSKKNAYSYMQVIPGTFDIYAKRLNYLGEHTPEINIRIGTQLLSDLYSYWGDWELALASYNAGKKRVIEYKGIPPFKETQDFVKFIIL